MEWNSFSPGIAGSSSMMGGWTGGGASGLLMIGRRGLSILSIKDLSLKGEGSWAARKSDRCISISATEQILRRKRNIYFCNGIEHAQVLSRSGLLRMARTRRGGLCSGSSSSVRDLITVSQTNWVPLMSSSPSSCTWRSTFSECLWGCTTNKNARICPVYV